jgi:redox-sensitive bicupin YhaK (pirin superfamily)
MSAQTRTTDHATVRNTTDRALTLILEPWANEYDVPVASELMVEGEGPARGSGFHITQEGDVVVVWAWSGSDARVLLPDGRVLADWTGLRVPELPERPA